MFPGVTNVACSLLGASNKPKSAAHLEKDLSKAVRAEGPPDENLWYGQENRNITHRNHGADVADGVFFCYKCNTENRMIHYRGDHPFKRLVCRVCDRVYSKGCATSNILQVGVTKPSQQPSRELRIGQLCPDCGLTHRAVTRDGMVSFDTTCVCGNVADESWIRFSIGSAMDHRCDPINFPTELNLGHKTKVIEQHNRTKKQKRVEQQMPIEKTRIVPLFTEKAGKATPTAPLCRQKVVYCGGKQYRVEMHRVRIHSYPVQGYDA
ncbi:uncharacterized protein ALTATR162_LOCUS10621 [Alternaria atra]|uniref:Probable double zinc ribbon domain-containing protein n=1 Tax=Alternaria atra TaxID=119953 RepID=A0A8J2I6P2_9PLEO|nr:uncharacterized protein ALTATR162_LOCUS8124 [Alternaria atra]XP_043174193.1 uncharacterized protein ALTATR162_LOCUS10621 [Alternaria atra]CAG5175525.1 unnamed protein product [Alternaria atra]CAG5183518.1 unnamed protein product [Alternaria atra]